eukprot:2527087-Pyramimonas_sp.AAC.1
MRTLARLGGSPCRRSSSPIAQTKTLTRPMKPSLRGPVGTERHLDVLVGAGLAACLPDLLAAWMIQMMA